MDSSGLLGENLSPESTVTSLLSSSGHLRSSLRPLDSSFTYRDKVYESASAALDAYILDFERSHQHRDTETLRTHNVFSTPSRRRLSTLRNKDVLRERLTEKELDFLNLPVSSLHHRSNRERLSMTTDELLSIPHDGTEPVTHTTAFIQGLLSGSGASQLRPSSSPSRPPGHRAPGLRSSPSLHHSLPLSGPARSCRCRMRAAESTGRPGVDVASLSSLKCARSPAMPRWGAEPPPSSSSLHLPHWLTSHKAELDCSGMSSLPDLQHPAWVQSCEPDQPDPPSRPWDRPGIFPPAAPKAGPPSWVADLEEEEDPEQFAEHISAKTRGCNAVSALLTDGRLESLIRKADHVLTSLSQGCAAAESDAPPGKTEELSLRPPSPRDVAAEEVDSTQTDRDVQAASCSSAESSSWKPPGPAEALKQMLFRLQDVEAELQRRRRPAASAPAGEPPTPDKQRSDVEAELQSSPGRPSLQRALFHLLRLKLLVEEPTHKRTEEEEEGEKEEDEGRYSSSSADGMTCSQQGAS
ncbi:lung adenoma susceptibility protein 2 isoform X2 [Salarias fasciatus]|uniref:Lung adenoma susceptibility protein 2 n=1 Tax=Salarias fasciatus TaxID=181472 RepID=A0A672I8H6_SALFA|nr:lung adenoma susceptibility protein 2 isoform X2 [Salarias fasciatus]